MITLIAGIVDLGGAGDAAARLGAMLDAMNPRGLPEARAQAAAGPARFGAIALSASETPAPPAIVAEGATLFAADLRLWDGSDDDAGRIAAMIAREGGGASAGLHGDFAWARWDGAALEIGRDHFGARPVFATARRGGWLAFASMPGALLDTGLAGRALHRPSLLDVAGQTTPRLGRHFYADIRAPRPAFLTRLHPDGRIDERRYWRLPLGPRLSERTDPDEVAHELARLLVRAVERRLPDAGPVGAHVSGGIDSTPLGVIAARAIRPAGRTLHAYSFQESSADLGFDLVDEAPYVAETVAAEPNMALVAIGEPGVSGTLLTPWDLAVFASTEPHEPEQQVLRHAAASGVGTVLSGWGGDQVVSFGGSPTLPELALHGQWARFRAERRLFPGSLAAILYYRVLLPLMAERPRRLLVRLTGRDTAPEEPLAVFRPAGQAAPAEVPMPPQGRSFLVRRWMSERPWIPYRLALFQQLGAPWGVRYVYPYLDLDLVAYAMRLPAWFFSRGAGYRVAQREAIRGLVPESVRLRRAKLFPHQRCALRMAEARDALLARIDAIPPGGMAAATLDLPALRAALAADIPAPAEALARLREHAARGEQYMMPALRYFGQIRLALMLGQYDREHGG